MSKKLTNNSQCAVELLENSMKKVEAEGSIVKKVIADTGYDTHEIFKYLGRKSIKAVITGNRAKRNGERLMVMQGVGTWRVSFPL